jgi:hypothetical protein
MPRYSSENPAHIGTLVFLDAKPHEDVTECDTDEGWLVQAKRDASGDLVVVNGFVQEEKLFGLVSVCLPNEKDAGSSR